jgi:hypothetical protein
MAQIISVPEPDYLQARRALQKHSVLLLVHLEQQQMAEPVVQRQIREREAVEAVVQVVHREMAKMAGQASLGPRRLEAVAAEAATAEARLLVRE